MFLGLMSLFSAEKYIAHVHFICVGMIFCWLTLNRALLIGYSKVLRKEKVAHKDSLRLGLPEGDRIRRSLGD